MSDRAFFDSNVILYLYSEDETLKQNTCKRIIAASFRVISIQVCNEISNVLSKKFHVEWKDIAQVIRELLSSFSLVTTTPASAFRALYIAERYRYSYFDSLIITSALESGCSILYSEDLQHGQIIEGKIRIVNPFLPEILY